MEEISRRSFLRKAGDATVALALGAVCGKATAAAGEPHSLEELEERAAGHIGMLFDSTLCISCRSCEIACSAEYQLKRNADEIFEGCPSEDARGLRPIAMYVRLGDAFVQGVGWHAISFSLESAWWWLEIGVLLVALARFPTPDAGVGSADLLRYLSRTAA
ncbi:MAG: hypothetical protein PVJ64_15500 [Gemmatimonadales bacterium]|jgi:hypothetical protein